MKHNYSFRRILSVLVLLMASAFTWAYDYDFQIGGLYYKLHSDLESASVVQGENKCSGDIAIPEYTYCALIPGKPIKVTAIADKAFYYCESITSIKIPDGVTSIGEDAFYWCRSITSINIPESVTSIGRSAFYECASLTSIVIPDGVTSIEDYAFCDCSRLVSVNIPESVTSIGNYAFNNCLSLTSIDIPASVTSIGKSAFATDGFQTHVSRNTITVSLDNPVYDSRGGCNAIIETATNTLLWGSNNTIIPASVTSIGKDAFYGCTLLNSINISNNVTSIGEDAFALCSLTSITVSSDNPIYDSRGGCNAIIETATNTLLYGSSSTIIPDGITSIGSHAFSSRPLTTIHIPNGVTRIGHRCFSECEFLSCIDIPESVTSIEIYTFSGCSSLTTVICRAENVSGLYDEFNYVPQSEATLYVPASALEDYKEAYGWQDFGTILPIEGNEDVIDGIDSPEALQYKEANTPYYTLDGKPAANPTRKGIYVKDGRKVMLR